jgi:hypothetical protein
MNRVPPTRVLSNNPIFFKRVIPWLFGMAMVILVPFLIADDRVGEALFFAGICAFGFLITRVMGRQFADEVLDGGDFLRIRDGDIREDVPLHAIEAVKEPMWNRRVPRIELLLKAPGQLGRVIAFIPVESSWVPFQKSALTQELEDRVERAQRELR